MSYRIATRPPPGRFVSKPGRTHSGFCSLPLTNPLLARRAQGFERGPLGPTDKTRSELRLLAYPKPDYRQRPNYLEKNERPGPGQGARSEPVTHYRFALANARSNPALGKVNGSFCGRPPGPTGKMWSESTFATNASPGPRPLPQCSASRVPGATGKRMARSRTRDLLSQ